VWIDVDVTPAGGHVIAHTDGQGANVRAEPNAGATVVKAMREGARVSGDDFAWRQVTDPSGAQGWMADAFLARVDAQFRVANTDGHGANLRTQPGVTTEQALKLVAEGTLLSGDEHAWRHVTDVDGTSGWVVDEFLQEQH
jgi:SH3-like domain-containing protein